MREVGLLKGASDSTTNECRSIPAAQVFATQCVVDAMIYANKLLSHADVTLARRSAYA